MWVALTELHVPRGDDRMVCWPTTSKPISVQDSADFERRNDRWPCRNRDKDSVAVIDNHECFVLATPLGGSRFLDSKHCCVFRGKEVCGSNSWLPEV